MLDARWLETPTWEWLIARIFPRLQKAVYDFLTSLKRFEGPANPYHQRGSHDYAVPLVPIGNPGSDWIGWLCLLGASSMNAIDKWADRVYAETDFGRSIATSVAGIVGLIVYLIWRDWAIAAFSSIIIFPIVRIPATNLQDRTIRHAKMRTAKENAESIYDRLCEDEKEVVQAFVNAGGCVLTWSQTNRLPVAAAAIESLIQRDILTTSVTADGMKETFVLDSNVFDIAQKKARQL